MKTASFTRNTLLMLVGPLVWAAHFLVIYIWTGLLCARPAQHVQSSGGAGWSIVEWGVIVATAAALILIGTIATRRRPAGIAPDSHAFTRWISIGLSLLSAVAIVWETLPVFLVPACT